MIRKKYMTRKEIEEMKKRWREALATPTKPLHDPVPLEVVIDSYLEGKELCEDCISRQAVLDEMNIRRDNGDMITAGFIKGLPPVTPKPKTGHWIKCMPEGGDEEWCYQCSECNFWRYQKKVNLSRFKFCPNCGAKMESGDKECR